MAKSPKPAMKPMHKMPGGKMMSAADMKKAMGGKAKRGK